MHVITDPMETMGAGDIIYSVTNHIHYQITSINATYVTMRVCLYRLGQYGATITMKRTGLKGLILIPQASG